ncbi:hypothetical protein FHR61_003616 [Xanthomonas arboricola]|uniref:Uncharacterized protein n=1 Tax=Xanthomonas cannabis TaxID=1885674 RepID=A0ABR6JQ20_9XANT|nr:hypothetical protein [Xanthomonas cannabis]MBB5523736.1 hypothetical protein [Xanthomonas cannabis]
MECGPHPAPRATFSRRREKGKARRVERRCGKPRRAVSFFRQREKGKAQRVECRCAKPRHAVSFSRLREKVPEGRMRACLPHHAASSCAPGNCRGGRSATASAMARM